MHLHPGFATFLRSDGRNSTFLRLRGGVPDSGGVLSGSAWETGERDTRGRSVLLARAVIRNISNRRDWARVWGRAGRAECVLRQTENQLSHLGRGGWGEGRCRRERCCRERCCRGGVAGWGIAGWGTAGGGIAWAVLLPDATQTTCFILRLM